MIDEVVSSECCPQTIERLRTTNEQVVSGSHDLRTHPIFSIDREPYGIYTVPRMLQRLERYLPRSDWSYLVIW